MSKRDTKTGVLSQIDTVLENAKIVGVGDKEIHVWRGGHGINVYYERDNKLVERDYYNVGDFKEGRATRKEVEDSMRGQGLRVHNVY